MKFKCNQKTFIKALNTVTKINATKTTIPITKGVLLTVTDDNTLKLTVTNFDMRIETIIPAEVETPGSAVVMAKLFSDIIRKLPEQEVSVEKPEQEEQLHISTPSSDFRIVSMPVEEFSAVQETEESTATLSFSRNMLQDMIRKTYFCASADESRGIIVGVLMELQPDAFHMVALDGFRMAIWREQRSGNESQSIVINAGILNEVAKIMAESDPEEDQNISLSLSSSHAVFLLEHTTITVNILQGEFIQYQTVLPDTHTTTMIIQRNDLLAGLERASLLAREGKNNLIRFHIEENLLSLISNSEEGSVKEEIPMEKEGEDLEIGFNSKYVSDALRAIEDEEVKLEFTTPTRPCLLKPLEGDQYEYLILPVRIPTF